MDEKGKIKIIVVDDHQVVIDGVRLMLSDEPGIEVMESFLTAKEAIQYVDSNPTDLVVMDINMPGIDGVTACKQLKEKFPVIKVLLLTMMKEASLVKRSLKAGADGYLLKHAGRDEIVQAIKSIYRGGTFHSDEVTQLVMSSFSVRKKVGSSAIPKISRREAQILKLIVNEMTTPEIAGELFVSHHTVESHRKNLLMKLGARNTAGLVRIALEHELVD